MNTDIALLIVLVVLLLIVIFLLGIAIIDYNNLMSNLNSLTCSNGVTQNEIM